MTFKGPFQPKLGLNLALCPKNCSSGSSTSHQTPAAHQHSDATCSAPPPHTQNTQPEGGTVRGASLPPLLTQCCTASAPPEREAQTPREPLLLTAQLHREEWRCHVSPCGFPPLPALELGFLLMVEQWETSPPPAGAAEVVASQKL